MGASNTKGALLGILKGTIPDPLDKGPLWFSYDERSTMAQTVKRARELIAELKPVCNINIRPPSTS
jgi:hypothetical protein